ncbi:MAG TPA: hypothetical protein VMG58_09450 [Candidatus Sulfotelmatobacter sp.]|nr:hypothetical protein [Candidatus Sulfotelmatobacter sp.]
MKSKPTGKDWLPLARADRQPAEVPTGEAFRPEWIDFDKGFRVGNLEPHQRITQILKYRLETEYGANFVTDRWGRGVFWQWICWLPRANREAKPVSRDTNFGCAKLAISQDRARRIFQCGLSVERGYVTGKPGIPGILLKKDWDWNRLMALCAKDTPLDGELRRLILREGFVAAISGSPGMQLTAKNFTSARQVREAAGKAPRADWAGFNLYYPMPESEVRASTGYELVQGILGAFTEVIPVMNMCMQVPLVSVARVGK